MNKFKESQERCAYLDGKHIVLHFETPVTLAFKTQQYIIDYYSAMAASLGYSEQSSQFLKGVSHAINQINSSNKTIGKLYK